MKRICKERNTVHDLVNATYDIFELEGEVFFQLDTYGRTSREIPGKISQSIQLDRETAKYIIKLLADAFAFDEED